MPTFHTPIEESQIIVVASVSLPGAEGKGSHSFDALVDTGAQVTMISQRVADRAGAPSIGVRSFIPANGKPQETLMFQLRIAIPVQTTVVNPEDGTQAATSFSSGSEVTTLLLPYQPTNHDILLGMDILSQFHITIFGGMFVMSV